MNTETYSAIIVAAGNGRRFGGAKPKQFMELGEQEVLWYSVTQFQRHPMIHEVIIVTSAEFLGSVHARYPRCKVVCGGETRQESVANGMAACSPETSYYLVHDAARPLLPRSIIDHCIQALESYDGVAPAVSPVDSMVLMEGESFSNLDRTRLRIIQTPQCFRAPILQGAHQSGLKDTDELGLVKQAFPDAKLHLIPGAPETFKITQGDDLERAAKLVTHFLAEHT